MRAVVDDCVLLSYGDNQRNLRVPDVDGYQIRHDGIPKSVERDWCKVLIQAEGCGVNRESACMEQGECKAD